MEGKITVYFWPDGTWCSEGDLEEYGWKSDDYALLYMPEECTEDDIEREVQHILGDGYVAVTEPGKPAVVTAMPSCEELFRDHASGRCRALCPYCMTEADGLANGGKMEKKRGMFITFEGGEGSGKTSVHKLLKNRLLNKEYPDSFFLFVNDPSSNSEELAALRAVLLSKEYDFGRNAELLLYGASRAELVEKLIEPALAAGIHVVSDRFTDSSAVYQGELKGHSDAKLRALNETFCGGLVPDRTFLFDVIAKVGLKRSLGRLGAGGIDESRWEDMGVHVHERINGAYRRIAAAAPDRFVVLDSNTMTIEEMAEAVNDEIAAMLIARMKHVTYNAGTMITEELWEDWVAMGLVGEEADGREFMSSMLQKERQMDAKAAGGEEQK